jgi:Protein of unknown function (DUF2950)
MNLIDQNGDAYEKDLGPTTTDLARQISTFNPDSTWRKNRIDFAPDAGSHYKRSSALEGKLKKLVAQARNAGITQQAAK